MKTTDIRIKDLEKEILTNMIKDINQVIGVSKTNFLSTGLFLKLPIEFVLEQADNLTETKNISIQDLHKSMYSTIDSGNKTTIKFVIIYKNDKHLKHLKRVASRFSIYFTFHYLKQLQHVLRRHNTSTYSSMMMRHVLKKSDPHTIISIANSLVVNSAIKDLFKSSKLSNHISILSEVIHFNTSRNATEMDVIKQLADQYENIKPSKKSKNLNTVELDSYTYDVPPKKQFISKDDISMSDKLSSNLAASIMDTIATHGKGSSSGQRFAAAFESVKIDVSWFDKIKGMFTRDVFYKTNSFYNSWRNISSTYRHIFNAPAKVYQDSSLNIIVSSDNSGSVSSEDLQKVLYLIESQSKKIKELTVIAHDVDIKVFQIEDDYDIEHNPNFKNAVGTRHMSGGTSHKHVFSHISKMLKKKDISNYIYICFSDMYSDIERYHPKHPELKKLTTYWLTTSNGREIDTKLYGGTSITLP